MRKLASQVPKIIAIDGPAASGKSTAGFELAKYLSYLFLDTGSMYRAATLAVLLRGIDPLDEDAVTELARDLDLQIEPYAGETDGRQYTVNLDGKDVTWELRAPEVDQNVSTVSSYQGVREEMVRRQREISQQSEVVMVGRDIGTVVLPDAPLKLFITASPEERARRRWLDRRDQGFHADYDEILADINRRDQIDSSREHSPLQIAQDAVLIDNTADAPFKVLERILNLIADRAQEDNGKAEESIR